jgi:hypothetical protein
MIQEFLQNATLDYSNWIVLLSLEPLAGELKYASVVWSAAGAWAAGQVGSPMSNTGGQHWGFYWRLPSLLLLRLHMPKSVQATKSWSISGSTKSACCDTRVHAVNK